MTPKEKAEELVGIYKNLHGHPTEQYLDSEDAKMCAIKAVTQIEQALTDYGRGDSLELQNMDSEFRYWWKVKEEIEKL